MTSSLPPTAPPGAYIEEPTNPFTPEPERELTQPADPCDEQTDPNPERSIAEVPLSLNLLSLEELPSEDTRVVVSPAEPNTNPNTAATSFYLGTNDANTDGSPRFLALVQSSKTVHFSLNFGRRHCRLYYDAASDDVVLLNTSLLSLWIAELDIQKRTDADSQHYSEVAFQGIITIRPGLWRLARAEGSGALADLLLLRRRYTTKIASKFSSAAGMKRPSEADQSSSKEKKAPGSNSDDSSLVFLSTSGSAEESEILHITTGNPLDYLRPGSRLKVASGDKSKATTDAYSLLHVRPSDRQVVVKVIQNRRGHPELRVPRLAREWVQEQGILRQLKHPFIVEFRGSDARFFSIYMEYLPFPDLGTMHNGSYLFTGTDDDASMVLHGMASALSYLEDQGIIHNDIKPANILFDRSRGPVLIDFGLATYIRDDPCLGGTPWYIGTELWEDKIRVPLSDVYALGVTLLYLLRKIPLPERAAPTWNIIAVAKDPDSHPEDAENMMSLVSRIRSVASRLSTSGIEGHVRTMVEFDMRARRPARSLWQVLESDSGGIIVGRVAGKQ